MNHVTCINGMFINCKLLSSLPNISKWRLNNVKKMNYLFYKYTTLSSLPNISQCNTNNFTNMSIINNYIDHYLCAQCLKFPYIKFCKDRKNIRLTFSCFNNRKFVIKVLFDKY